MQWRLHAPGGLPRLGSSPLMWGSSPLPQGPDAGEALVASFTNDHVKVAATGEVYRYQGQG